MSWRSYIVPVFQALLVHALVIAAFTFNWESDTGKELPPPPQVVQAKILTMADPIAARKETARKKEAARKKAEAKRRAAEKRKREEAKRKAAEKKKAEAKRKAEAKKKADAKKKSEAKKKADAEKKAAEEKAAQQRAEEKRRQEQLAREKAERLKQEQLLADSLADEIAAAQEEDDRIAAQSYDGLVRQRIMENWHIPLSARNGMVAKVVVHFLPTGEINTVALYKSSGDAAFDRSVVLAVQRVGKIEELQQLEPRAFDKYFRKRIIKFRPEDLDR